MFLYVVDGGKARFEAGKRVLFYSRLPPKKEFGAPVFVGRKYMSDKMLEARSGGNDEWVEYCPL